MNKLQQRAGVLAVYEVSDSEREELLEYNQNVFEQSNFSDREVMTLPLADEPHVKFWREYATEAQKMGTFTALKKRLVQFQFPIAAGISQTEDYRAATLKGKPTEQMEMATGLFLHEADRLHLGIKSTSTGSIPILTIANREDFVTLVRALTKKNEPVNIPDSMGACIVGGYNNWDRIHQYRRQWQTQNPHFNSESEWNREFKRLIPHKELYQDRFILLSSGTYSNMSASSLGLTEKEWLEISNTIRLEHECTHYFTRRFLGSMRNNLLDETIADYRGIVKALGTYRADWFLKFLGLESFPEYREGGRLENYRGDPPLSAGAFRVLGALIRQAAKNLENFDRKYYATLTRTSEEEIAMLVALSTLTLEELAAPEAETTLLTAIGRQKECLFGIKK